MKILSLNEIKSRINIDECLEVQKDGFRLYSSGQVTVPKVGHLGFKNPPGDMHIKYGMVKNDSVYIVKIASGFANNPDLFDMSAIQGMIIVFCAKSGEPLYLLQDDGFLTNYRTALAGLICAEMLGPKNVRAIGVIGSGIQARLQLKILKDHYSCRQVWVYGRDLKKIHAYQEELTKEGYVVECARDIEELAKNCNYIVTTTYSAVPILLAKHIKSGTHITAVGSDAPDKNEIDPEIFALADICVVDSLSQCQDHGDSKHAIDKKMIDANDLIELGKVLDDSTLGRTTEEQITIADLTGVAIQDIQIAKSVLGI